MKILSGDKKGMNLYSTVDENTRPTEAKVRESIFNVLFRLKPEAVVLDLFSGTGAIGIEFISHGAKLCVFSEYSRDNVKCINDNLQITKFGDRAKVYKGDFKRNLLNISATNLQFDYVYIDPPYDRTEYYGEALEILKYKELLQKDAVVILESNVEAKDLNIPPYFSVEKEKKYGMHKYVIYLTLRIS